jgi:hypothetical protein
VDVNVQPSWKLFMRCAYISVSSGLPAILIVTGDHDRFQFCQIEDDEDTPVRMRITRIYADFPIWSLGGDRHINSAFICFKSFIYL